MDLLVEVIQRWRVWCVFGQALSNKDTCVQRLYVQAVLMGIHRSRRSTRRKHQTRRRDNGQRKPANDLHGVPQANPDFPLLFPPGPPAKPCGPDCAAVALRRGARQRADLAELADWVEDSARQHRRHARTATSHSLRRWISPASRSTKAISTRSCTNKANQAGDQGSRPTPTMTITSVGRRLPRAM